MSKDIYNQFLRSNKKGGYSALMATTLAAARAALWKYASNVPYAARTDDDRLAVDTVINAVMERFLTSGKWRGTTCRARFSVYDGQITLPESLLTVLGWASIGDDGTCWGPGSVFSQWYDFVSGPGPACHAGMVDLGENWPTFRDSPYDDFTIKIVSSHPGETANIILMGADENGRKIYRSNGIEGVKVQIRNTGNTTTQVFSAFYAWVKTARTRGIVRVYAVDELTAEEALLAYITPGKMTSGYRRYKLPGLEDGDAVECMCKRAYVAAVADNDFIIPSNTGALKLGMMALQFEDKNDLERAAQYMTLAIDELDKERSEWDGDNQVPTIRFVGDYGAGSILNVT